MIFLNSTLRFELVCLLIGVCTLIHVAAICFLPLVSLKPRGLYIRKNRINSSYFLSFPYDTSTAF